VRELENAIERAAILARREEIGPDDLPPHVAAGLQLGPSPALPRQVSLAEAEREHILQTLERFGRNHSGAAEALGIGRTTLWRKLKEYGIDRERSVPLRFCPSPRFTSEHMGAGPFAQAPEISNPGKWHRA
jgi:DNA-binding NtrC family response regulator